MKKDDLNKKQRYALDTMLSGSNVFLTGDAGTGKTTVIQTTRKTGPMLGMPTCRALALSPSSATSGLPG